MLLSFLKIIFVCLFYFLCFFLQFAFYFVFLFLLGLFLIVWFHFGVLLFVRLFSCFLFSLFLFLFLILYVSVFGFFFSLCFVFVWFCFYHLSGVLFVHWFVCLFLIVAVVCLFLSLIFTWLLYVCLFSSHSYFSFFFSFFFSLFAEPCGLRGLWSQALGQVWASGVGALSPGWWNAREFLAPGNINKQKLSQRSPSKLQDLVPPNCLQIPVLKAPCQTTSKTGAQTHPSADSLPKIVLKAHRHTKTHYLTWPAHQKEEIQLHPPEHRYESLPPGTLHKPLDQTYPQGANTRSKRNYDPEACRKETSNTVS